MNFHSLKIFQFRNLKQQEVLFSKGTNIILGDNAQGKTNLIEALVYMISGKSFRPFHISHFIPKQAVQKSVYVCADFFKENIQNQIELKIQERAKVYKNDKPISWAKITKEIPYVLFSPESLNAIKAGPGERRDLIDESLTLVYPDSIKLIRDYARALRSRNRLLSDYKKEKIPKNQCERLINSLNPSFLSLASEYVKARIKVIQDIQPYLNHIASDLLDRKDVDIFVEYVASGEIINDFSEKQIEQSLKQRMLELASAEMASGITLIGPQKHDIRFLFDHHDSRYYCSQGQQRALILTFKMAKIMYYRKVNNHWPLLFLDDVLSELDRERRTHLIRFLRASEGQKFITSTDYNESGELVDEMSKTFIVSDGKVMQK